ncbi:unnamed protein product [Rotaria magnacalcarata]|uniref:Uncharacterized protein n=3 Tax=Rotaria magnacalcarata TaxID=392030 RepID=A0A816PA13_9BILA|nr:unnamed protein product [Rotaria magnacalcarata]CAF2046187.1 unnamed protein product [Rotaria magnacalcarata]CAF2100153.1 unnamed protein product [Rotaria magnacalcarata]CAF2138476.1 unnamed protein product [Rotaria magnacalcarata]CAF3808800.1 unnamed protein product [Rotaria magnacalcarata]
MYSSSYNDNNAKKFAATLDTLLKHIICSFVRAQVLFGAIRLNLFTMIEESSTSSLSYEDLAKLNVSFSMLSYLVYLRLLKRRSNSNRYECTHVTRTYLVSSRQNYVGLGIGVWDHRRQYTFFLRLNETLKYGIRTSEDNNEQSCLWSIFEQKQDPMISFARIMSSFTRCTINELCDHADFSTYSTLLDIGGSLGDLSRTIVTRYPHLNAFSFDLPELTCYASSVNIDDSHVHYVAGNFFEENWPDEIIKITKNIDLVSLKYILHDWTCGQRRLLIEKIYKLLKTKIQLSGGNGTLLVIEKMIDDDRGNITTLSTSISMAIECGDGIGYDTTQNEYRQLLFQAGFQRIQSVELTGPMIALFAHVI